MSKLLTYDFRCKVCSHKFEDMVKSDVFDLLCPKCGHGAKRLIPAPRIDPRLGLDPSFPTMGDRWAKVREQRRKIEDRRALENGDD